MLGVLHLPVAFVWVEPAANASSPPPNFNYHLRWCFLRLRFHHTFLLLLTAPSLGTAISPSTPKVALTLPLDFEDASITRRTTSLRRVSISSCPENTILHITTPGAVARK